MKKKILFINGHLDSGGCERSLIDVLKKLDYKKYEVDLLLLEHTGDYLEEVPEEVNIKVYSLDNAFGRLVPCLVRAIRKKDWFSFWFRVEYICGTKVSRHFMVCMRKLFKDLRKSYDIVIAYRPGICTELAAFTRPVIAHAERYEFIQDYPQIAYRWFRKGYVIQANKGSFLGRFGGGPKRAADSLLRHNLISVIASDAHSPLQRTPYMMDVYEELSREYSENHLDVLFQYNPARICDNREILRLEPVPYSGR